MRANNDPLEGNFATFTDVLCNSGKISIDSAAGIGQARYNKDLDRKHGRFITRGKGKETRTDLSAQTGTFHTLPEKLQDSLLAVAKKMGCDQGGSLPCHYVGSKRLMLPRPLKHLQ